MKQRISHLVLLSLVPPHMTGCLNTVAITAAPDDMNRMTVLHSGNVVQLSPITRIQLSLDCQSMVAGAATDVSRNITHFVVV